MGAMGKRQLARVRIRKARANKFAHAIRPDVMNQLHWTTRSGW